MNPNLHNLTARKYSFNIINDSLKETTKYQLKAQDASLSQIQVELIQVQEQIYQYSRWMKKDPTPYLSNQFKLKGKNYNTILRKEILDYMKIKIVHDICMFVHVACVCGIYIYISFLFYRLMGRH